MRPLRTLALLAALVAASTAATSSIVVRKGDTLSELSERHRVSVADLARLNGLRDPDVIRAGRTLRLPGSDRAAIKTSSTTAARTYTVRKGDTLAGVARRFGMSPQQLAALNGIVKGRLYTGATLRLAPASSADAGPTAFVAQPVYTVKNRSPLSAVARKNGVSTTALARLNGLSTSAVLAPGTKVLVPGKWICPVAGRHTFVNSWGFPRDGGARAHEGIDMMAKRGTPIVAPVSGTVKAKPNRLGGVAFDLWGDDGVRYYGSHLDRLTRTGNVKAGQVIGTVGDSGSAKGGEPHLHIEFHPGDGPAVNPYPTLLAAC